MLTALSVRSRGWLEALRYQGEAPRPEVEGSCCSRTGPKEQHLTPGWAAEPSSGTDSRSSGCRDLPCPLAGPSAEKKKKRLRCNAESAGGSPFPSRSLAVCLKGDNFAVASAEVFQVRPSASHSLAAWDTEEILFIGARPLHVRRAFFLFFP